MHDYRQAVIVHSELAERRSVPLRPKRQLSELQKQAVSHIFSQDEWMLWADVGTGKTVIVLTALFTKDKIWGETTGALVIAPPRVSKYVWPTEAREWQHLQGWSPFVSITGMSPKKRKKAIADNAYVVANYELLPWLAKTYPDGLPGKQALIFDEVDKLKDCRTNRWKAICGYRGRTATGHGDRESFWLMNFAWRGGMTGTPRPNHLLDVWAQVSAVDGRKRLGKSFVEDFRKRYFYADPFNRYSFLPIPGMTDAINTRIEDMVFRLKQEEGSGTPDVRMLPAREVDMTPKAKAIYNTLKRSFLVNFGKDKYEPVEVDLKIEAEPLKLSADSAGVCYGYLRQIAQGHIYCGDYTVDLHEAKWKELRDLVSELQGEQLMVVYHYQTQREILEEDFGARCMGGSKDAEIIEQWNAGELEIMGIHPQSAGHGLNLQKSGAHHICLLTLPESAGMFEQVLGRLVRRGNTAPIVFVHRILARNTVDMLRDDAVAQKIERQKALLEAMENRV